MKEKKSIQTFREKGPQSHIDEKSGTPTIGGVIFLFPFFFSALYLFYLFHDKNILLIFMAFFLGFMMGFADDFMKVMQKNYAGLNSLTKLLIQFLVSAIIVYFLNNDANYLEYIWAFIVIAGTSNAFNLTDGLDGLCSGISVISFLSLGIFLYALGSVSSYLMAVSLAAALLAFLIFNKNPAQIFMGDTGSLSLGMGLGSMAYIYDLEWYLLAFAFIPVLEAISVILQVGSAKLSRTFLNKDIRPFKMAPLHHHFELSGMKETLVVPLFWIIQLIMSIVVLFLTLPR